MEQNLHNIILMIVRFIYSKPENMIINDLYSLFILFGSLFFFFVCRTISYVNYLRHCYLTFVQKSIRLNKKHQFKLILTGNLSVTIS